MSASQLPKVFVLRPIPPSIVAELRKKCQVFLHEDDVVQPRVDTLKSVAGMDGLYITPHARVDKELLDAAGPQLKVISTASVGLDHIDLDLCKERGIKVGYTPGVLSNAVAELALGLTLATARRFGEALQTVHNGVWGTRWENYLWMSGREVAGSVVGIVGLGRIGLAIAKRIAGFEVSKILYTGRNPNPSSAAEVGAEYVGFDQLLEQSDFVIAACSINDNNKGLFNANAFKKMKSTSVFVNITRGSLVDQEALYEALTTGQIGAAGLDVTTPEPLPPSHPLLALKNCVITPHIGSATEVTRLKMCNLAVDNLMAGLEGNPLKTPAFQ